MNKVVQIGNLTKDTEVVEIGGSRLARFTIAVSREYTTEADADFFNVSAWGKLADICEKWLKKGMKVAIVGRLRNHIYEKDGVKKQSTEIVAEEIDFLSKPKDEPAKIERPSLEPIEDIEIPF